MGKNSTINNESWKLCLYVCIICTIILVSSLQNVQDKLRLSAFKNMAFSFQAGLGPKIVIKDDKKCNLFDGNWVYDPKGSPSYNATQCPFLGKQVSCQRNGRPESEYEKWSWEANGCQIPRFNGTKMLERLRGKRLIIVGDSLNRNQWESLACLLYSSIPSSQAHVDFLDGFYKVFKAKDYNCSVEFHWSPFLVDEQVKLGNGSRILRLDRLSSSANNWLGADVMVFNTGHWWMHRGASRTWDLYQYNDTLVEEMESASALSIGMRTWANWIDSNINASKTAVFFRGTSPQHNCYNSTKPLRDEPVVYEFHKPLVEVVEQTIRDMRTEVQYLNITDLSGHRSDAHPSVYARMQDKLLIRKQQQLKQNQGFQPDCSHWCLPGVPDTWNKLLYASLVLDS